MVCELFSIGYETIELYALLNYLILKGLFTLVKAPQTIDLLL